jgi:hypothetical protein
VVNDGVVEFVAEVENVADCEEVNDTDDDSVALAV